MSNRDILMTEEPQLDSFSYAFITSFLQPHAHITTSYENIKFQTMNSTLLSFLLHVMDSVWVSSWEFHSYMPAQARYSFFTLCSIWICTNTNAVTTVSEFSEQTHEQWQSSGLFSLKRYWQNDSTFSWASVYYCMETSQLWLTAHCFSCKSAR